MAQPQPGVELCQRLEAKGGFCCLAPHFQGFRPHWKPKLGVYNFSLSPDAFFFPLPSRFSAPQPLLLYLFFLCECWNGGPGIQNLALHRAPYLATLALRMNMKKNTQPPLSRAGRRRGWGQGEEQTPERVLRDPQKLKQRLRSTRGCLGLPSRGHRNCPPGALQRHPQMGLLGTAWAP